MPAYSRFLKVVIPHPEHREGVGICFCLNLFGLLLTLPAAAQSPATYTPTLTFEVASIHQNPPPNMNDVIRVGANFIPNSTSYRATSVDNFWLVTAAFNLQGYQISNLSRNFTTYNITAKSDPASDQKFAALTLPQQKLEQQHMLQQLLIDRFQLKYHWETREGPTYNLVATKSGPKLSPTTNAAPTPEQQKWFGNSSTRPIYQSGSSFSAFDLIAHNCTLADLIQILSGQFGRPVIDQTQLTGHYDFTLHYLDARITDRRPDDTNPTPTLDTALEQTLGLKLVPAKGPIQVLVIDHIEKPTEN